MPETPALLISTSSPPSAAIASGTILSISARWLMSQRLATSPGISRAISARPLSSISQMKTLAPVLAKARANSRPMPAAPAVIRTFCGMRFLPNEPSIGGEQRRPLLLLLRGEIERIAVHLSKVGRLLGLGLGNVAGIDGDHAGAFLMRGHHRPVGLRFIEPKYGLQDLHDELARRVVVIEQDHLPQRRPGDLRLRLGSRFCRRAGIIDRAHEGVPLVSRRAGILLPAGRPRLPIIASPA